jgi:hypothetical protein
MSNCCPAPKSRYSIYESLVPSCFACVRVVVSRIRLSCGVGLTVVPVPTKSKAIHVLAVTAGPTAFFLLNRSTRDGFCFRTHAVLGRVNSPVHREAFRRARANVAVNPCLHRVCLH